MATSFLSGGPTTPIAQPSDLDSKLDADAGAPDFSTSDTYEEGEWVNYNGKLWRCHTAVTTSGDWTGVSNWTQKNMTSPDATLDITSDNALRVVAANGTQLWMQGYNALDKSSEVTSNAVTLSNEAINYIEFAVNAAGAITITLPTASAGKVSDLVLEVKNPPLNSSADTYPSAWSDQTGYNQGNRVLKDGKVWICIASNGSTQGTWVASEWQTACIAIAGLESTLGVLIPKGEILQDMLTISPGEVAELYFTLTKVTKTISGGNTTIPMYKVMKLSLVDSAGATS